MTGSAKLERAEKAFVKQLEHARAASDDVQEADRTAERARATGDAEAIADAMHHTKHMAFRSARAWSAVNRAGRRWINLTEPKSEEARRVAARIKELMGAW